MKISETGRLVLLSLLAGFAVFGLMLATEPKLAIVWDEGYTLGREARLRQWFSALLDPAGFTARWQPPAIDLVQQSGAAPPRADQVNTRAKLLFDPKVVAYFWPFAREEPHGHPPFYALLGLIGDMLVPNWQELPRARFGPILLFSLTAGVLFHFMAGRWGIGAAIGAAAAWVFQPNLFGHGHYATYDAVLSCLWVLAIIPFANSAATRPKGGGRPRQWATVVVFGMAVGCALATKLTGWFLPVPFLVWAILVRNRRAFVVLAAGLTLAVAVLYLLCPPWWSEPIAGPVRFFQSNLTRGSTIPIPVLFLGTTYQTPNESLPWYNTLAWTAMVTPVGFLLLGLAGIVWAVRRWRTEPIALLILGHWILLLLLRAMPHTPGHDGVRLFLPAFAVLAMLVGLGVRSLWDRWPVWARLALAATVAEGLLSVIVMMPVCLSYFSPLVGGLPGAAKLGMEPTYYWDALDDQARAWLREHTMAGQTIRFATNPTSWRYLRQIGQLPPRVDGIDPGYPAWYVMQNRPGAWLARDLAYVRRSVPVFTVSKFGVPLVWVFPFEFQSRPVTRTR